MDTNEFTSLKRVRSAINSAALRSAKYDAGLLEAVAYAESLFNPNAKNETSGALGLLQLLPTGAVADYRKKFPSDTFDLFSLHDNIKIGAWYLFERIPQMLRHYDKPVTHENMLWAYNAGIGRVLDGFKPDETKIYIPKVLAYYHSGKASLYLLASALGAYFLLENI